MKFYLPLLFILLSAGCKNNFYTEGDFPSVPKVDAHVHISSPNGYFEEEATNDRFILVIINVDTGDSVEIEAHYKAAIASVTKYPGKVFYSTTFHFDTAGWGTDVWANRTVDLLSKHLAGNPVSV